MHLSAAGLQLLKESEGFRNSIYVDVAGFPNHRFRAPSRIRRKVSQRHHFRPGRSHSCSGHKLCRERLSAAWSKSHSLRASFDALVDFVFNLGAGRLASSTLLRYLNAGKYDAAAWQLLAWDHAASHEIASLKLRREAEFRLWSPVANRGAAGRVALLTTRKPYAAWSSRRMPARGVRNSWRWPCRCFRG